MLNTKICSKCGKSSHCKNCHNEFRKSENQKSLRKKYFDHIYINMKDNTDKYWYNSYKYNINDTDVNKKIEKIIVL